MTAKDIAAAETLFQRAWEHRHARDSALDLAEVLLVARRALKLAAAALRADAALAAALGDAVPELSDLRAELRAQEVPAP